MKRGVKPNLDSVIPGPWGAGDLEVNESHIAAAADLKPELTDEASFVWDQLAPELVMLGRLKRHHVHAFAEYCKVFARKTRFETEVDLEGWVYESSGRNGELLKIHPLAAQINETFRQWRSLAGEFGLTPASERGINTSQGELFDDFARYAAAKVR